MNLFFSIYPLSLIFFSFFFFLILKLKKIYFLNQIGYKKEGTKMGNIKNDSN